MNYFELDLFYKVFFFKRDRYGYMVYILTTQPPGCSRLFVVALNSVKYINTEYMKSTYHITIHKHSV